MDAPVRVLLVHGNTEDAHAVRDLLEEDGPGRYQLRTAATFDEALDALTRDPPDICLVGQELGARSGVELIRVASTRFPSVPAVLMTDDAGVDVDHGALQAGAVDYLPGSQLTADRLDRRRSWRRRGCSARRTPCADGMEPSSRQNRP